MKKYIAPTAEVLSLNAETGVMLVTSPNYGDGNQLSNNRDFEVDTDWDEE